MSELLYLGAAERYYFGGYPEELPPVTEKPAAKATVTLTIVTCDEPEELEEPKPERHYRNAGRKKLTAEQILANEVKAEQRKAQRLLDREIRKKEKWERLQRKSEIKKARQARANQAEVVTENLQRLRNQRTLDIAAPAKAQQLPDVKRELPKGMLHAIGSPVMPGYTAIRIDHKTVIYVKNGKDLAEAASSYKIKHGITI